MVGSVETSDPRVVFLGDSITDGWRLNQYFAGKQYLNRGISGQITGQMLGRTKPDVIDLRPSVMVLAGWHERLGAGRAPTPPSDTIWRPSACWPRRPESSR